jgi:DNA-binding LytR/AlgR family response regulator
MFDFLNKSYPFNTDLGYTLKLGSGIAIGVFLFILFFQPLSLDRTNVESYILTVAGFAGITFLVISLVKIIIPAAFKGAIVLERWNLKKEVILMLLIWILNSVAFSFYLAYVGKVPLSMYLAFRIVLICLALPVLIMLVDEIYNLRNQVFAVHQRISELEDQKLSDNNKTVPSLELLSENRSEKLGLDLSDLLLVRSAENYVEVLYFENQSVQKKLLRATMLSIEAQLRPFKKMVRCHRTCIVNTGLVEKLQRTARGIRLRISGYDEEIPVSRQYLLSVKAALDEAS